MQLESPQELTLPIVLQFVEHVPLAAAILDTNMRYLYANAQWVTAYGLVGQAILGRSHYEVFPEISDRWKDIHQRCLAGAVITAEADPFPRADGRLDYVTWEDRPWYTDGGEVGGLIMFTEVVTKQVENHLQLEAVFDTLNIAVVEIDPKRGNAHFARGKLIEALGELADIAHQDSILAAGGRVIEASIGDSDLIHQGQDMLRQVLTMGDYQPAEFEVLGRRYTANYIRHHNREGALQSVTGIFADITTQYEAQRHLTHSEQTAATLYDLMRRAATAESYQDIAVHLVDLFVATGRVVATILLLREDQERPQLEVVGLADSRNIMTTPSATRFPLDQYPSASMFLNGEGPIIVEDVAGDANLDEAVRQSSLRFGAKSMALIPLRARNQFLGGISLTWYDEVQRFDAVEQAVLAGLTNALSPQIAQFMTLDEQRRINAELTIREIELQQSLIERAQLVDRLESSQRTTRVLYDLSRRISSANSYQDVAALLLLVFITSQRYSVMLILWRPGPPSLLEVAGAGDSQIDATLMVGSEIPIADMSALAWWQTARGPLFIPDLRTDTIMDADTRHMNLDFGVRSQLYVPLRRNRETLGVLVLSWFGDIHELTALEQATLEALPNVVSPQVAQLMALEEQRRINQQLSQRDASLENALHERERLIRQLEDSMRFKDQFLSTMSHELRTPLNAIQGYAGLVLDELSDDDTAYMVKRILDNSKRLLTLINDILDISRINADRVALVERPVDIWAVARGWHTDFRATADKRKLAFTLEIDPKLPRQLVVDVERLGQVVGNLLENAFKFTEGGGVILRVASAGDHWRIEVADTGPGIPETWKHLIFDEFRQVDSSTRRKYGGAGLGLSIVKKLAVLMGGTVTVDTEVGRGSTFSVNLPAKLPVAVVE